ncbi:NUDIX hydrolase OS=Streptomyces paromomycinus OX=92743 GN=GKJPGBOP_03846 PE=3 SV=1 [Streptomyces rimosus subsp. rimosus]
MARGDLMGSGTLVALLHIVASRRKQGPPIAD